MLNRGKLLVIGSLNMDMVVNVARMPGVGETLLGRAFKLVPGGKGANQAYACAMLGGETYMLGAVGNDQYGERLLKSLESAGVYTEAIEKLPNIHTGMAFIYVDNNGDNSIVVVPGANWACSKEYIYRQKHLIEQSDILIFQLEIPLDTVSYAIDIARKLDKTIILDPAPAPEKIPGEMLQKIDIITPNESELITLTGGSADTVEKIKAAAEKLLRKGVKDVVVTRGKNGALWINRDGCRHYEAEDVKVVDTTAAGDSFTAAVAVALSEGKDLDEAIRFANKVAAVVVTREGAQTSIPSRKEID